MKLWSSILLCSVTVISCRTSDSAETKDSSWVNPGSLQNKKMTSAPDSSGRRFNINVSYQTSVEAHAWLTSLLYLLMSRLRT